MKSHTERRRISSQVWIPTQFPDFLSNKYSWQLEGSWLYFFFLNCLKMSMPTKDDVYENKFLTPRCKKVLTLNWLLNLIYLYDVDFGVHFCRKTSYFCWHTFKQDSFKLIIATLPKLWLIAGWPLNFIKTLVHSNKSFIKISVHLSKLFWLP